MRIWWVDQTSFTIIMFYRQLQLFNNLSFCYVRWVEGRCIIWLFSDAAKLLGILLRCIPLILGDFSNRFLPIMFSFRKALWIDFNLRRLLSWLSIWIRCSSNIILIANSYTRLESLEMLTVALLQFDWLPLIFDFLFQWFLIIKLIDEVLLSHLFSHIQNRLVDWEAFFFIFERNSEALTSFLSVRHSFLIWRKFLLLASGTSFWHRTCLTILLYNVLAALDFKRLGVSHLRNVSTYTWTYTWT